MSMLGRVNFMRRILLLGLFTTAAICAQTAKTGPAVGQFVPDFYARDAYGQARSFKSVTGRKGLMLVFFRSADW
jgi:hypothetical protein